MYYAKGIDYAYNDVIAYELKFDDGDSWSNDWVTNVDSSNSFTGYLSADTDGEWVLNTIDIPDTVPLLDLESEDIKTVKAIGLLLMIFLYILIAKLIFSLLQRPLQLLLLMT